MTNLATYKPAQTKKKRVTFDKLPPKTERRPKYRIKWSRKTHSNNHSSQNSPKKDVRSDNYKLKRFKTMNTRRGGSHQGRKDFRQKKFCLSGTTSRYSSEMKLFLKNHVFNRNKPNFERFATSKQNVKKSLKKSPPLKRIDLPKISKKISSKETDDDFDIEDKKPKKFTERYVIESMLGEGSNSQVFFCRKKDSGKFYAVKRISYKKLTKKNDVKNLNNEIKVLKALKKTRYTCRLYEVFKGTGHIYLVMSYEGNQHLKSYLNVNHDLTVNFLTENNFLLI